MKQASLDALGVSAFCESMAMMLHSGIQVEEAVSLLQSESARSGGVLEQGLTVMQRSVEEGYGLSTAMKESGIFPDYALKMVSAAESAGRLEDTLQRLSAYYAQQKSISDKLRSAVTYPLIMLVLIIVVLAVMLTMVLPAFADVYENLTGSLSASAYPYIRWAYAFCWIAVVIMALVALALILGLVFWRGGKRGAVEKLLRRLPVCGQILESLGLFRFTSALDTFLSSGEMQDTAVLESIPMTDFEPLEERLNSCARRMEEGHSFARAAYDEALFEPVYGRMLLAGERSGDMDSVLRRLIGLLQERCGHLVDRLVGVVDPLLSGALMVTVGLSLLSVMLPLIGLMNSVG